ncbi:tetratricopeptide repeat protein [Azospirillum doebereinerae]|uniref:Tetratricopeptide repeat protein n=1 Tax=Azospirillum doebereinerae TaxID=92933 RepID=A0A3S0WQK7_9PROT|nr:tetratricopeptide repeat protein [Azospirillum doebereinerae]RUQ61991.1 tetratricopeptide repeat protein [Azospirillum doebereinerae]
MSEQTANGHDNVLVSVDGNNNTVTITLGRASLTVYQAHKRKGTVPRSNRELLFADFRTTKLVGRDDALERFGQWLTSPAPIAVDCVIGRGGAGKTRFGIELCERAEAAGWIAGFITSDRLITFYNEQNLSTWLWKGPTLLVIDYAAANTAILRNWLDELALRPDPDAKKHPLRILLLERHADRGFGWWADLAQQGSLSGRRGDYFLEGVEPFALPTLADVEDRRSLMAEIMEQAARLEEVSPAPHPPAAGADPVFDRDLSADSLDNEPLYLMMAAIVALDVGVSTALSRSRTELAGNIAAKEVARLERIAKAHGAPEALFSHLAACVTLQGGCDRTWALRLIGEEQITDPAWSSVSPKRAVVWLADGVPGAAGGVDAIRPDLIGGAFVLSVLRRNGALFEETVEIVERAWRRAGVAVAQTIIRTAMDHAGHDPKHDSLKWLDHLIGRAESDDVLMAIADAIPKQTVALRECACVANERLVDLWRLDINDNPKKVVRLAAGLNNLASFLSALGRREKALAAATEAVTLRRQLAKQYPDAFTPDLARSLNTLANRLSELGRCEDALAAATEATGHYRQLAKRHPDAFTPNFAMSLNNLANFLSELGRREDALAVATEAADHCRQLTEQHPDAFTPDLALSLNTLANCLSELGRHEDALAAATDAADHYRQLAKRHPDAFTPDLAMSLNNLAGFLSELGRREDALAAATDAADHYRQLAKQRPDAFTPNFAMSLNNLANRLSQLGRREDALAAATEAVDHYRQLAKQRPDASTPDLARSLAVLANCWDGLGDGAAALEADREAIATLSAPFLQFPPAFADLMRAIARQYIQRCERLERGSDKNLLIPIPILEAFQRLRNKSGEPEA